MWGLGVGEILIIGLGLTLLFGAKKIPDIARGLGSGLRNFKGEVKGPTEDQTPRLPPEDRGAP
jgi:sec-independent protein translocase protein TatA